MNVTIEDAYAIAGQLKASGAKIYGIELFGSVLRNGAGHDIDLVFTVDDSLAREFWSDMSDMRVTGRQGWLQFRRVVKKLLPWIDEAFIWKKKQSRQARVSRLVGVNLAELGEKYRPGTNLDVWLLPLDWRVGSILNEPAMFRIAHFDDDANTLLFLARVAREAVKIA